MTEPTKQVMMTKLEMLRSRVLTRMHEARCPMYPDPCGNDDCGNEAEMLAEFERAVRSKAMKECESSWDHGHETGFQAGRAAAREEARPTCKWTRTAYTYDDGIIYETGCGFQYGVDEDQLGERFCWFCGGKIEEARDER